MTTMDTRLLLLIGTRKGGFIARADAARRSWTLSEPFLKGSEVHHVTYVRATGTIVAAAKNGWWGPTVRLTADFGGTWREPAEGIRFAADRGRSVERVWVVEPDPRVDGQRVAREHP